MTKHAERDNLIRAAIHRLACERANPSTHSEADIEAADDLLDDAARALAAEYGWIPPACPNWHPPGETTQTTVNLAADIARRARDWHNRYPNVDDHETVSLMAEQLYIVDLVAQTPP